MAALPDALGAQLVERQQMVCRRPVARMAAGVTGVRGGTAGSVALPTPWEGPAVLAVPAVQGADVAALRATSLASERN
jgi:hypothetical protein